MCAHTANLCATKGASRPNVLLSILHFFLRFLRHLQAAEMGVGVLCALLLFLFIPQSRSLKLHQVNSQEDPSPAAPLCPPPLRGHPRSPRSGTRASPRIARAGRWRTASRAPPSPRRARDCDCRARIPPARAGSSCSGASSCGSGKLPGKRGRSPRARPPARGGRGWRRTAGRCWAAPRRCRCWPWTPRDSGAPAPTVRRPQRFWLSSGPPFPATLVSLTPVPFVLSGLSAVTPARACGYLYRREDTRDSLIQHQRRLPVRLIRNTPTNPLKLARATSITPLWNN